MKAQADFAHAGSMALFAGQVLHGKRPIKRVGASFAVLPKAGAYGTVQSLRERSRESPHK